MQRNISLTDSLDAFANAEAEEGGYPTVSAFFADLLRSRRQAKIEADVKLLANAVKDAGPEPEPMAAIVAAQKKIRRQMRKEGWQP